MHTHKRAGAHTHTDKIRQVPTVRGFSPSPAQLASLHSYKDGFVDKDLLLPSSTRPRIHSLSLCGVGACVLWHANGPCSISPLPEEGMQERCSTSSFLCLPFLVKEEAKKFTVWTSTTAMASCSNVEELECRNVELAFHLKLAAMLSILFAGAIGVALPLVGKKISAFKTDGPYFAVAKAFAAGVILATGFVHMLSDAMASLTDSCLPDYPWKQFPFSGCIAMMAALGTLMLDVIGTEYYERKHAREEAVQETEPPVERIDVPTLTNEGGVLKETLSSGHIDTEHIHVVGMRAHAVSHTHSHSNGSSCSNQEALYNKHGGHAHCKPSSEDMAAHIRHVVVSQVLELGIVTHSIIIGISLGVSQSPCTIRPLFAALAFHQFFEGFALGGCISQAGFKSFSAVVMTVCFTLTTPLGIGVGTGISSGYNSNSPGALIVEGIFDSISAGILIYMALVDLIAADFLSKRMCCNRTLQVLSYLSLFVGAAAMSSLAVWA